MITVLLRSEISRLCFSLFAVSADRMKTILSRQIVDIPEDVHSKVTVEGPRGTLWRDFKHISVELSLYAKIKRRLQVDKWLANKELALLVPSAAAQNLIKGVVQCFCYKVTPV